MCRKLTAWYETKQFCQFVSWSIDSHFCIKIFLIKISIHVLKTPIMYIFQKGKICIVGVVLNFPSKMSLIIPIMVHGGNHITSPFSNRPSTENIPLS